LGQSRNLTFFEQCKLVSGQEAFPVLPDLSDPAPPAPAPAPRAPAPAPPAPIAPVGKFQQREGRLQCKTVKYFFKGGGLLILTRKY